jgi:hypothetical protein
MPKPVKKAAPKKRTTRKPSADPMLRAKQQMAEQMDKLSQGKFAAPVVDTKAIIAAHMSAIGKKGGDASGKARMKSLTNEKRTEVALKAAQARWAKRPRG